MFKFLFLSNLLPEKGVLLLLDACCELKKRGCSFICHVVGNECSELSLSRLGDEVSLRGLPDAVQVHGPLYGENKDAMLRLADALVFPTYYHNECFPLVILEAMKHALPVISTRLAAIPDMVEQGVTGLLVPPRDVAALADAMQNLMADPESAARMGEVGRVKQQRYFTAEQFENTLCSILRGD